MTNTDRVLKAVERVNRALVVVGSMLKLKAAFPSYDPKLLAGTNLRHSDTVYVFFDLEAKRFSECTVTIRLSASAVESLSDADLRSTVRSVTDRAINGLRACLTVA